MGREPFAKLRQRLAQLARALSLSLEPQAREASADRLPQQTLGDAFPEKGPGSEKVAKAREIRVVIRLLEFDA